MECYVLQGSHATGGDVSYWAIDLKLAPADASRLERVARNGNTSQKLVPEFRCNAPNPEMALLHWQIEAAARLG